MNKKYPPPVRWLVTLYSILASGRHKFAWINEFMIALDRIIERDGEEAAWNWALVEFTATLKPAVAVRLLKVVRILRTVWKLYQRFAAD